MRSRADRIIPRLPEQGMSCRRGPTLAQLTAPMRIIGRHVRVWPGLLAFPWAPETTVPPTEDATPKVLLDLMAGNGVRWTGLLQVICGLLWRFAYS